VAGMKPKIICLQCGSALTRKDMVCPSCGVVVDWEGTLTAVDTTSQSNTQKKETRENISVTWSSKLIRKTITVRALTIFGAIALIALAIIVYAVLIEKRPVVDVAQQQASQPVNTQMQLPSDIQELENSVAANPDDMSLTLQLANSLHDRLFYDKAIPYYKAYLMMNPKDANARVDMGICYKEIGNFTEAESEMKMALHYVPNHLFAHFNLGIVYLNEGNLEESNKWFKRTVALDPNSEVGKRAQQLLTQHNSQSTKQE
jgi:tetratricopeptide (TPR) repeat protein